MEAQGTVHRLLDRHDLSHAGFKAVFDNFFSSQRPLFSLSEKVWNPPADVYETPDHVVIKMEIAGVSREKMEITVENNFLVIRGCRREDPCLPKESFHLMEIRYGRFERVFGMPVKLQPDKIEAQYNNGFLVVTIAKASLLPRQISIEMQET
ncbi:Hsp20/alpha crystallin family protein [Candidatus Sumerlaeota bacterium]|nr:Hsp20/alpha crystallin family protein [Candidatus Sumerlaeota bacterium]